MPYRISQDTYTNTHSKLNVVSQSIFREIQKKSIEAIFKVYSEPGATPDQNGILDIAVSFDGAWQRRGHSSHNGVGTVIDLLTGLPVDYEVLCNFCYKCQAAAGKADKNWEEKHKKNCPKNYDGSSNSMEAEFAVRLWP